MILLKTKGIFPAYSKHVDVFVPQSEKRVLLHFFPSHHHVARFTLTKLSIVKFILSAFGVHRTHTESSSVRLESSTSGDVSEGKPLKYFWHWRWSYKDIQCIWWLIPHTWSHPYSFWVGSAFLFDSGQMECGQQVRHGRRRYSHNSHNHPRQSQRNGYGATNRSSQ